MKVVFFRHSLLNRGGDKMVLTHAGYLAEQGWDVEIETSHCDTIYTIPKNVKIRNFSTHGKLSTMMKAIMRDFNADRVIVDIIPLACCVAIRNRHSLIYFAQDYDEEYFSSCLTRILIRLFYYLGLSIFKIPVIAVSEYLAEIYRRKFGASVVTVNNGIDKKIFLKAPDTELIAQKAEKKAILILSRRDTRKGSYLLKNIFSALMMFPLEPVIIWSVGAPFDQSGLTVETHDFGYVNELNLRRIMSSADLFLYPTRHEGFGLMPLEAMACGCPVVSSTALKIATHEINAMLSPVGDVESLANNVCRVLTEPQLAERLVTAGYDLVDTFSLEHSTSHFAETLLRL